MVRISLHHTLSLGDLRIALLSYLYAKKAAIPLIVRLESEDEKALEMLPLLGISYQYLYHQSDNVKYHLQFASMLLDTQKAFICFCQDTQKTPYDGACEHLRSEEILNNPNPFVIRLKSSKEGHERFILMRTDKYPTALFANACDDMLQGVSCVIREQNNEDTATKEASVRTALGYTQAIQGVDVPCLEGGDVLVKTLLNQGFLPEAIVNYLITLGTKTPTEIFTLHEALSWFSLENISKEPVSYDREKLQRINHEHKILQKTSTKLS